MKRREGGRVSLSVTVNEQSPSDIQRDVELVIGCILYPLSVTFPFPLHTKLCWTDGKVSLYEV